MKRSLKNLLMIIVILASLFASNRRVEPAIALGAMENVAVGLPAGWQNGYILDVWGTKTPTALNAYAVGYGNTPPPVGEDPVPLPLFYHGSNTGWTSMSPELPPVGRTFYSGTLQSVWSTGTDVFIVGYGSADVDDNPATPPVLTTRPLLYYYLNNSAWNIYDPELPGISSGELYGVWGLSSSEAYAVGYGASGGNTIPLIYHFNADWWSAGVAGLGSWTNVFLKDVWGSGPGDVYAVGSGNVGGNALPVIYHYDGTTWTPSSPGLFLPSGWTFGSLEAVWGSGPNDIYAVGSGGINTGDILPLLLHYQDGSWSASSLDLPGSRSAGSLSSVWGVDTNEVYLAGGGDNPEQPLLYRKAGNGRWAPSYSVPGWTSGGFTDLWGYGSNNLYAVGSGTGNLPLLAHAVDDAAAPGAVSLMAMPGGVAGTVNLNWTAPADDAGYPESGPVDRYKIIYSQSTLTDCSSGTEVPNPPAPKTPGSIELVTISGLEPGQTYNFSVCTWDEEDNPDLVLGVFATPVSAMAGLAGEGKYDDTDGSWLYTGTWSDYTGTGPYNNTTRYTSTTGSEAQFTFSGVKFTLTYTKASNRGLIDVYVDGTKINQINAYSAATRWQQTWTSPPLSPGSHTVRFVHAGGRAYIDVDAIQIFGQQPVVGAGNYDDVHTAWRFSSGWNTYSGAGPANNTSHYTGVVGSDAQLIFTGNRFTFTYAKTSNRGLIDVYVDGTKINQINAKSTTTAWQQVWSSPILTPGPHIVRFVHAGGGTYIDVDAVQTFAPSDHVAPAAIADLNASPGTETGTVHLTWTAPGDDGTTGTATNYLVRYSTSAIDDSTWEAATPVTTGMSIPATPGSTEIMTVSGLTPGATYFFAVRAQDEEGNTGAIANSPSTAAQSTIPVPAGTYDDTDVNWIYTGSWTTYIGSGPYHNTSHYINSHGSEAQITIDGARFIFTYVKANNRGLIDVYVDGTRIATINARSTTTSWQAIWISPTLTPGEHIVRFVHAGTNGTYIDVDKIQVLDALGAGTYEDTDINWVYTGTWTSYTGAGPSGFNDHYTNVVGSEAQLMFTGTGFTLTYVKATNRGSIDVYVDGVKRGNIDARSTTTVWQSTWTAAGLPSGPHTVRFVHVGPSGTYIDIDAITIVP